MCSVLRGGVLASRGAGPVLSVCSAARPLSCSSASLALSSQRLGNTLLFPASITTSANSRANFASSCAKPASGGIERRLGAAGNGGGLAGAGWGSGGAPGPLPAPTPGGGGQNGRPPICPPPPLETGPPPPRPQPHIQP